MSILNPKDDVAALQPTIDKVLEAEKSDIQMLLDGLSSILDTHKITIIFERK